MHLARESEKRLQIRLQIRATIRPIRTSAAKSPDDRSASRSLCLHAACFGVMGADLYHSFDLPSQPPQVLTMDAQSQRRRDVTLSSLNAAIEAMNLAKEIASVTPAKAVFGSVSVVLTMIKVSSLPVRLVNRPRADVYRIL